MQDRLPKREEVSLDLTWRLEDIYDDEKKWEEELSKVTEVADKISAYEGKLSSGGKELLEACRLSEELYLLTDRIYGYAHMREDQDTGNSKYQALKQRAMSAMVASSEKTAFMDPEILTLSDEKLSEFYSAVPELDRYKRMIGEIRRLKDHMLDADKEQLLASAQELMGASQKSFEMLNNADLKFPSVKDSKGEEVQLSNGRFVPIQMS